MLHRQHYLRHKILHAVLLKNGIKLQRLPWHHGCHARHTPADPHCCCVRVAVSSVRLNGTDSSIWCFCHISIGRLTALHRWTSGHRKLLPHSIWCMNMFVMLHAHTVKIFPAWKNTLPSTVVHHFKARDPDETSDGLLSWVI